MSLINLFRKKNNTECFTTPSHGQKFFIFNKFRQFYKHDISETDCQNPQLALDLAQKKASKIYGTKSTYFLTNGSTSGVIAAVLSCVFSGEKVLIADGAHVCHRNAVELAGGEMVFYTLEHDKFSLAASPAVIEDALVCGGIKAVIVTSPSYEGVVSDIKKIAAVCEKYGAYLIVDEAHGALYPFCEFLPTSAIYLGADFVVQSLHKTAGGLNPTALLHCCGELDAKAGLDKINTTSPSYPLLMSIEANINFLNSKRGRRKIKGLVDNIEMMKKRLPECEFFGDDVTKILVGARELKKIEDEINNGEVSMFLCGIGTEQKKLNKLARALKHKRPQS